MNTKDKRKRDTVASSRYFKIFKKEILGKKILSIERRAKNILINLSGGKTILVHLKMTGHLLYGKYKPTSPPAPLLNKERGLGRGSVWIPAKDGPLYDPFNRFVHTVFVFSNGKHLAFSDARKFGKITLLDTVIAHDPEGKSTTSYGAGSKHLSNLGPEPLEKSFTLKKLKECLKIRPNAKIKSILIDQRIIAGIGNIYSDEILWRSGVHPERKVSTLKESEIKLMFKAIKETLTKGINFGGDSMSDYRNIYGLPGKFQLHHEAYRRTGEKCRKKNPRLGGASCQGIIIRKVINGRSAHFCSVHQK